jgi:hypothetical protein
MRKRSADVMDRDRGVRWDNNSDGHCSSYCHIIILPLSGEQLYDNIPVGYPPTESWHTRAARPIMRTRTYDISIIPFCLTGTLTHAHTIKVHNIIPTYVCGSGHWSTLLCVEAFCMCFDVSHITLLLLYKRA